MGPFGYVVRYSTTPNIEVYRNGTLILETNPMKWRKSHAHASPQFKLLTGDPCNWHACIHVYIPVHRYVYVGGTFGEF